MSDDFENIVDREDGGNMEGGGNDHPEDPASVIEQLREEIDQLKEEREYFREDSRKSWSTAWRTHVLLEHVLRVSSGLIPVEIMPDDANPDEWVQKEPDDLRLKWIKEAVKNTLSETQDFHPSNIDDLQKISKSDVRPLLYPDGRTDGYRLLSGLLDINMDKAKERAKTQAIINRYEQETPDQDIPSESEKVQEEESQTSFAALQSELQDIIRQVQELRSKLPPEMKSDT